MSIISDRVAAVAAARLLVEEHPMCARIEEDKGYFYIIYPHGGFPVHGLRASKKPNLLDALERVVPVMERHWLESFP